MIEFTFATVQRAFAEAMARPPIAADEARALAAVAEAEGKPCVLPDELIARLEAEACSVLGEVEPMHSMKERRAEREERAYGNVLYDYDPERGRVVFAEDDWRPRATRTPSGWAIEGGWLDEPVPPLPTGGVPNAGGVAIVLPQPWLDEGGETMRERHPGALFVRSARQPAEAEAVTAKALWPDAPKPPVHPAASPYGRPRGWCEKLSPRAAEAAEVTEPEQTWATCCGAVEYLLTKRAEIVRAKGEGT